MDKIIVKKTSRVRNGHLWIFSNELSVSPTKYAPGSLVEVYDKQNNFLGTGYINPNSLIAIRLLTRKKENIDSDFFRKRILNAVEYRDRIGVSNESRRLIFSEGDLLPGLIVDKYNDCIVVQFLTLGINMLSDTILELIEEIFSPKIIVLRNDSSSRALEGLPLEKKVLKGTTDNLIAIHEGNIIIEIYPLGGQKTGFFLDQRENRIALSRYIHGGKGLDLFCYSGAWGLQLAENGADVTFVDESDAALTMAERNAGLSKLTDKCMFIRSNVFNYLRDQNETGNNLDFIVLDPPAFVKSRTKIKEAMRGYREINSLAMRMLKNGGVLATSSCSHHIDRSLFLDLLRDSARDAGKTARLIEYRYQSKDHPILLGVPETEYLKCAFLEII